MNNTNNLKRQGERLIPAIAYGDAAGLPVETQSAEYIAQKYGRISRLIETSENPFFSGTHQPGFWSDDTQLSIAVANGLIKAGTFDLDAIAEAHITAYDETPEVERKGRMVKRGWGGSTVAAMELVKAGVSPLESGTLDGAGNGVLMKMAPLVYWQFAQGTLMTERHHQYDQLTTMTHDSDVARLTTRVHGDVLYALLENGYDKTDMLALLDDSISLHEFETNRPGEVRDLLGYLHGKVDARRILAHTDGKGFYAPQTLAMAYGAFIMQQGTFTESIYEAVNLGGDTDSTGSIVAAMSTFAAKEAVLLNQDYEKLDQLPLLEKVSKDLASHALKR